MYIGIISVLIIIGYMSFMLIVSIKNRKTKGSTAVSFFLANRGVNSVLLPLTMIAAMQSTFAFLGAPGMYYAHGISYIVIVLSQVWVALMVIYFGNKIRKLAKKNNYMSIGDYFEDRFKSKYIKILASCISVVMTMVFLAMQFVGNARAMSIVSYGVITYKQAIIVTIIFSLLYVLIGGAGGIVILDAIQSVVLLTGIIVAAWIALVPLGGIEVLFKKTIENTPDLLSRPGPNGLYNNKYWIMQFIVLPFGIWLCPHIWVKSLMAKDKKALALSAISIPVSQILIFGFSTLFIGLAGHELLTDVKAADNVLPMLMMNYSNWILAALIMAAAIAAGTSTINAMLLATSQIVSQDLVLMNRKNTISDRNNLILSRVIVLIVSIICGIIAINPPQTLILVVQDVAYTGLAQLAPAFVFGLYWKQTRKEGVILGMTFGILILFLTRIFKISPFGYPGFLWAFFGNIVIIVIVSLLLRNKQNTVSN